jgi:hypothetical protein
MKTTRERYTSTFRLEYLRTLAAASLVVLCLGAALPAFGQTKQAVGHFSGTGGSRAVYTDMVFQFGVFGPEIGNPIFDTWTLTPNDVGRSFVVTAAVDPDFDGLAYTLSNGITNLVGFRALGLGYGTRESQFFSPLPPDSGGVDFLGYTFDSFTLVLDKFSLNESGGWTDYSFSGTITADYHATIAVAPEPGAAALFAVGAVFAVACCRRGGSVVKWRRPGKR